MIRQRKIHHPLYLETGKEGSWVPLGNLDCVDKGGKLKYYINYFLYFFVNIE
jgi:hypothetical protein